MHGQSQFRSPRAVWGPQVDGEADGPFVSSEDSSPATGFESNFYLPHIPATKSPAHTPAKRNPLVLKFFRGLLDPDLLLASVPQWH